MSQDEYEPAITETTTDAPGAESTITTRTPEERVQPVLTAGETGDDPLKPPGADPRGQRVISDKVRAMFRDIATKSAAAAAGELTGIADDLVPMGTDSAPAAAEPVAAVPTAPAAPAPAGLAPDAAAAPPPPAAIVPPPIAPPVTASPATTPDVARAAADQAALLSEMRDKQLKDREAAIEARAKTLPDAAALIERPGATLADWLSSVYGITDPTERQQLIADITAELSESSLGTKLPADYRAGLESRKAMRSMRAYKAEQAKERESIAAQRAAAEKEAADARARSEQAQHEARALGEVATLIEPLKAQHKFLFDSDVTNGLSPNTIVWEVVKEQDRIAKDWGKANPGQTLPADLRPDLAKAAKIADDYYKAQADELSAKAARVKSRLSPTLLAPAPTSSVAPAVAVTPPGAAPGPAARAPATPQPPTETEQDPADSMMDRRDRRAASLRKLAAKHKVLPA